MKPSDNVAIFWDYENCPAPSNASGYAIVNNITSLVRDFGNVKVFKAYLEIPEQLPLSRFIAMRSELQSSGVSLIDCPHNGRKEVADKMLIVDMLAYAIDTPSPATVVLITGDRDFAYALSILKLRGYRIILMTLPNAHASLTAQASTRYDWQSDIVNPLPTASHEHPGKPRQSHRSTLSSDGRNINPETPPQLWRNLPDRNNIHDNYEDQYSGRTPGRTHLARPVEREGRDEEGRMGEDIETGITHSFQTKDRRNPNDLLQGMQQLTASEGDTVNKTQKKSAYFPVSPNKGRTPFQIRPERFTQASTAISSRDVWDPSDDSLSDLEFSPEDSLIIGPASGIAPPDPHDVDAALSRITEAEEISRLTLSDKRSASEPPLLHVHNSQSRFSDDGSPAYTQNTLASTADSAGAGVTRHSQSTHSMLGETSESSSSFGPTGVLPESFPFTPNKKLMRSSTTVPVTEPPPNTPNVPPIFTLLVQVLQGHRAKGFFLSYRTVVAGRISRGGTTYKQAGVNNYRQYLNLAEKAGIIELGGSGELPGKTLVKLFRTMKNTEDVAIFWDYENCNAPANASGYLLASNIASLARPYGTIRQFRAYLEITEQPASSRSTTLRSELQSSGVSLIDCPHNGRKEVADKMLLVDMLAYAIDNPAPATMVIITGDRDFAYALATLKLRRYKLVLITLPHAHISLRCQASVCFDWFGDVVNAANTLAQQTLPSVSSHRHQQRRSSEYGVPKQRSPPLNASRHGSDPTLSHVGSAPDVDINQYLLSPQERRANETFQWDVGCTGLGRKEGTEKATTHDGRIDTPSLRKQTSSVDSLPLPSTLHSKKVEGNHRGLVGRSYQILGTEQPPFFQINGLDDEALSLSSYSIPSTPEGSILGSSTPHSFAVGIPPERNESTVSTTASTSQHFPLPRTSLSLPMNLPYLPSANLADHASAEKPNALDTLASMKICTDPMFNPLIDILRSHMFKGRSHPLRSAVGLELAKRGNVYGKAGAVSFKDYVAMAEKEGLVSLGGRDGHAWITLLDLAK